MLFWLCFGWDFGEVTSRRVYVCNGDKGPLWDSEKGNSACDIREVSGNRRRPADVGECGGGGGHDEEHWHWEEKRGTEEVPD